MTNATTDDDAAARRRAADRERKRAARAAAREARGDAEAGSRACAHGPSASEPEPIDLATIDGIRSTLAWALAQVQSDRTNSPTNRARVAAQIAREASALLQVHTLADRVAAIESAMTARQEANRK